MNILDALSEALTQAMRQGSPSGQTAPQASPSSGAPAQFPGSLSDILASTGFGSLAGIVERLSNGGLQEQVRSWLGNGANLPVSADQIRSALGDEQVQRIAQQLGIPIDRILQILSQYLPAAVDQASPNGKIEEPATGPAH